MNRNVKFFSSWPSSHNPSLCVGEIYGSSHQADAGEEEPAKVTELLLCLNGGGETHFKH